MATHTKQHNLKTKHFSKKEAIEFGFETAKKNISLFISLFVIIILANIALGIFQSLTPENKFIAFLFQIPNIIVSTIISMGVIVISLKFVDKKTPKLSDLYYTKGILNYFLVSLIRGFIILVGFLFFIIPGIIFAIKLQFATYLVVDKNLGIVESLKKSWEMTKGVKWNLFLFFLAIVGINILGLLAFIVGLVITIPLSMVATAYVYRKLLH